jgi:UPF0755 protein
MKKRSRFALIFALPIVALACLLLIYLAGTPFSIPDLAAKDFGPASPSLGTVDRIYLSAWLLLEKNQLFEPATAFGEATPFQVVLGESPISIIDRLQAQGLIDHPESFRRYLIYSGLDTQIQAGDYILNPMMSPIEIAQALRDPTPGDVDFVILAGWRMEEIARSLPTSGLEITPEDFLMAAQNPLAEGYLFPGKYTLPRETSVDLLIRNLLNAFHNAVTPEMEDGFSKQGLTLDEAVILASIIQRESVVEDEMPLIASVFLNRLAGEMKLDADPTVQYALGFNASQGTWWTNPLSGADLEVVSAYNTYLYPGLPPGPICNPGLNALKAVAFPAQTPYYFFRAACDGSGRHLFAETFEGHIANQCP